MPDAKISPIQRIARITNAKPTPTLFPLYNPPWIPNENPSPQIIKIGPPPKDKRQEYTEKIKADIEQWSMSDDTILIATDGSRRTTHNKRRTGAGIVVRHKGNTIAEHHYHLGRKSNTYDAESIALLAGIRKASEYANNNNIVIRRMIFLSDSASAITNITRTNAHPSQQISIAFNKIADTFTSRPDRTIKIQWVPGHQNIEINERADYLAKKGCRPNPNPILSTTTSYLSEKRSKLINIQWKKLMKNPPPTGTFKRITDLDALPPTNRPNKTFKSLLEKPEIFGRLTQIRTMHGYNPIYYRRFNIDQPLECPACHNTFTHRDTEIDYLDHVFRVCQTFDEHRNILTKISRDASPYVLLGSDKGLLAVAKFIEKTGAFTKEGAPYQRPSTPELAHLNLAETIEIDQTQND
jgi:ribonuclease HI